MSVTGMLAEARKSLGLGEPNHIQSWYRARNGSAYSGNFPWCDAAVTYWAHRSGNHAAVCPAGDRAYTVFHALDFQRLGRWHYGVSGIRAGDVVFFDWGLRDDIGAIDHVGVVEKVLSGGRVQTIEGNTANVCARRVRSAGPIAGYGRPAYTVAAPTPSSAGSSTRAWPGTYFQLKTPMMRGGDVKWVQQRLNTKGASPKLTADGVFGPKTDREVRDYQKAHKLEVDGIVGSKTWGSLAK